MYINKKYHWVQGQGYNSRSKVNNLGQTCLIHYRLYITSSPCFAGIIIPLYGLNCAAMDYTLPLYCMINMIH